MLEAAVKPKRPRKTLSPVPNPPAAGAPVGPESDCPSGTLTFVAADGERLVFTGLDLPLGEVALVAGEEALGKIWNRPAEDAAWRDM